MAYSRSELIEALQELADELGHSPTLRELMEADGFPSIEPFLDEFGSWNAAKEAAGLSTSQGGGSRKEYSKKELVNSLRRLAKNVDGRVTKSIVNERDDVPGWTTFKRYFGSWNEAKKQAGLEPIEQGTSPREYSDEELLEMLRSLAEKLGRSVTQHDMDEAEEYPSDSVYKQRFGSWNRAKELAGLSTIGKGGSGRSETYSGEELLDLLRELSKRVEGSVSARDMDEAEGYPSSTTYQRRFGSWREAKKKARLLDNDSDG